MDNNTRKYKKKKYKKIYKKMNIMSEGCLRGVCMYVCMNVCIYVCMNLRQRSGAYGSRKWWSSVGVCCESSLRFLKEAPRSG